ncbi:MAG: glycosyltransferase family 2 protein [Oligoflexales bacterium]
MNNFISVVCPTFNSASYLEGTLKCLLDQSVLPFEVVFSDDYSTDNTLEILTKWEKKFSNLGVRYVVVENPHMGPGATRNAGILAAHGSWISFLDSDDVWYPQKIEQLCKYIEDNKALNTVVHWETYQMINGNSRVLKHGSKLDLSKPLAKQIYKDNVLSTSAVSCKKSLLTDIGMFDQNLPVSQDFDLWLRIAPKMKLGVIETPLGIYVERPGSISAKPYYIRYFNYMKILIKHRHVGGIRQFLFKSIRATISKQWLRSLYKKLAGNEGH